jgi:hypothetical protein
MEGGGRGEKMEGGGGEEKENEKKSDVECHIRLWRFGCGDLGVSVTTLKMIRWEKHTKSTILDSLNV